MSVCRTVGYECRLVRSNVWFPGFPGVLFCSPSPGNDVSLPLQQAYPDVILWQQTTNEKCFMRDSLKEIKRESCM